MKIHSETASLESIRKYLRMKLARAPKINPTSRDKKDKIKKSKVIPLDNFYLSVHEKELGDIGEAKGVNIFHRSVSPFYF